MQPCNAFFTIHSSTPPTNYSQPPLMLSPQPMDTAHYVLGDIDSLGIYFNLNFEGGEGLQCTHIAT